MDGFRWEGSWNRWSVDASHLGFDNAFGAGDWLYTGMNCGCVEGALMVGLRAARAISGYPRVILGNDERIFTRRR